MTQLKGELMVETCSFWVAVQLSFMAENANLRNARNGEEREGNEKPTNKKHRHRVKLWFSSFIEWKNLSFTVIFCFV